MKKEIAKLYGGFDLYGNDIPVDELLRDKFIEPPFSVLNTATGSWQNRKKKWINLGIKSELGRSIVKGNIGGGCYRTDNNGNIRAGQDQDNRSSIFDPALCEILYSWFCPEGGLILDPFAGGSVRGIVANYLGYKYTGIELRDEQISSNVQQAKEIIPHNQPLYIAGDSDKIILSLADLYNMIFTCPPYMNLEVYSDNIDDLSNMSDELFIKKYRSIIKKSCLKLRKKSFAVFVVGDLRDKNGYYKDFISITKNAFYEAGMKLYNDAILLNAIGSSAMRCSLFMKSQKLVKTHQNILIFKKP